MGAWVGGVGRLRFAKTIAPPPPPQPHKGDRVGLIVGGLWGCGSPEWACSMPRPYSSCAEAGWGDGALGPPVWRVLVDALGRGRAHCRSWRGPASDV